MRMEQGTRKITLDRPTAAEQFIANAIVLG
jgi:hypothetical protein